MDKQNCFAYIKTATGAYCKALTQKDCFGCVFFKNQKQAEKDMLAADKRLKKLGIYDACRAKYNLNTMGKKREKTF